MKEITQTKEGFIKSMILFVVLLGVCFAPFFAFGHDQESSNGVQQEAPASLKGGQLSAVLKP